MSVFLWRGLGPISNFVLSISNFSCSTAKRLSAKKSRWICPSESFAILAREYPCPSARRNLGPHKKVLADFGKKNWVVWRQWRWSVGVSLRQDIATGGPTATEWLCGGASRCGDDDFRAPTAGEAPAKNWRWLRPLRQCTRSGYRTNDNYTRGP